MKTNCEQIINSYMALDQNQRVPLKISRHLLTCQCCSKKIELISLAEKTLSKPLNQQVSAQDQTIQQVMEKVNNLELEKIRRRQIPLIGWIVAGLLMISLFVFATIYLKQINSEILTYGYGMAFAGSLIAYSLVFVYSHLDAFVKKISTVIRGIH